MSRLLICCLIVFTASPAAAQVESWRQTFWKAWDGVHGVIVPPSEHARLTQSSGGPDRDYTADVSAYLKGNPNAPYLCAALHEAKNPFSQWQTLRANEVEICKAYAYTSAQLDVVHTLLNPAAPARREQIVMQLQRRSPLTRWYSGMGIYAPPPLDPIDWINGNSHGRDYRADLVAAFDADPLEAATVCVSASHAKPSGQPNAEKFYATLLEVCNAFPDAKIESAFAARQSNEGRTWLTGLLNALLDDAATLSTDLRRQRAAAVLASLPTDFRGSGRFQNALRVIAMTPEDWRGPAAVLRYSAEASQGTPGALASEVKSWLDDWYSGHSNSADDTWNWKRGARGFYALTGQLERAHALGKEVANHRDSQQHALDLIYQAVIERAEGNPAAYTRLFANCPAPDPMYLQQRGQPERRIRYCEDIASDFSRAVRDELGNAPQAAEFAQIALETNRVSPAETASAAVTPPADRMPSPSAATDDWFTSIVKTESEKVAKMTRVQREETAASLNVECLCSIGFDAVMRFVLLRPWHEAGAYGLLRELKVMGTSSGFDKPEYLRRRITKFFLEHAESGPDSSEWKRGLRGYLLYSGEYARALDLSRELIKTAEPRFAVRDAVLLGLTERVAGNRKVLDETFRTCPQAPAEELERYGADPLNPGDYCRQMVTWDISRAITLSRANVPNAYREILTEIGAHQESDCSARSLAINELLRVDPDAADHEWRDLLHSPRLEAWCEQQAYWGLARIAEQKKQCCEGITWVDRYIEMLTGTNDSFTPALWKELTSTPEGMPGRSNQLGAAYDLRLRLSIKAGDFENAHRTIEDMLIFAVHQVCSVQLVRLSLIQLAAAEAAAGQRQEPLRILGYVARQPLNDYLTAQAADVRKQLRGAEPKPEDTPWDSPARKRRRINIPPPGAKAT